MIGLCRLYNTEEIANGDIGRVVQVEIKAGEMEMTVDFEKSLKHIRKMSYQSLS